jgi:CDP-4-dehydro-6-deoxyglucose reductase, E1
MSPTQSQHLGRIVEIRFDQAGLPKEKHFFWLVISEPDPTGSIEFLPVVSVDKEIGEDAIPISAPDLQGPPIPFDAAIQLNARCSFQNSKIGNDLSHVTPVFLEKILRLLTLREAKRFYRHFHLPRQAEPFIPGRSRIPYAGRVYDDKEMANLVEASLDFWLTAGRFAEMFEGEFAKFLGVKYCSLTNSGSSANLLAFMALTSPKLENRGIQKGDEVITVAAGFPTTVTPIIQAGAIPVFLDITLPTYNIDCDLLDAALSPKTKALMLAHTMGNPFDVDRVLAFCKKHNLWLIEDCCDALGSRYESALSSQTPAMGYAGSFGHLSTFSFYPPHHITMGEGGAVCTNDLELKRLVESFRDWGRDCQCPPGKDDTCRRRFSQKLGELPFGYDHKYVYSHFGYNLKVTDMQAALGCAQLVKLPDFITARKKNWDLLRNGLADLSDWFILPEPSPFSDPSWFGFLLTVRENVGFTRDQMVAYLESAGIQTRMLFAGDLLKHPCFDGMRKTAKGYRIVSSDFTFPQATPPSTQDSPSQPHNPSESGLPITDYVMTHAFWIGVYPGMSEDAVAYAITTILDFIKAPPWNRNTSGKVRQTIDSAG